MTADRSDAYRRVLQTLDDLGPSKLLEGEQETIREAADHLLFTEDLLADDVACDAVMRVEQLCRDLVESERWELERAMRLTDDVYACGPPLDDVASAAAIAAAAGT
jgi:hypothetical protein